RAELTWPWVPVKGTSRRVCRKWHNRLRYTDDRPNAQRRGGRPRRSSAGGAKRRCIAEDHMLHTVLIILHAAAALVCFAAGVLSLGLRAATCWRFRLYFWSLLARLLLMAGALA